MKKKKNDSELLPHDEENIQFRPVGRQTIGETISGGTQSIEPGGPYAEKVREYLARERRWEAVRKWNREHPIRRKKK